MQKPQQHLPPQPTSFIGREVEVAAILELLEDPRCRLLTLVGPGGIGKTRLGIEAARQFLGPTTETVPDSLFPDGVYFVGLQSVPSADNIVPAIASAIGFEFYEARHPERQLINYMGDKQLLLILDNLEHLPDAGDSIGELLAGAPRLKIVATSREPLNLREEWLFHVEGMPVPDSEREALDAHDATRLFVERARRVRHSFSPEDDRACVVRLCQLVDGMPLAIELSATWLRTLGCHEIVTEIERNLDVLETDMRGVPDRHRSMRAVFDYSWQLLDREEQELFMKLSVFQGGFRREAAEQIAGASLQTLSALVDKSMVVVRRDGRYQIHELQRQYGVEQLGKAPDLETAVGYRHCEYFTAFMDRPFGDFYGYHSKEVLKEIDAESDNVQAAWNWAVAQGRWSDLRRCVSGLYHYAFLRFWVVAVEQAFDSGLSALRSAEPGPERDATLGHLLTHRGLVNFWLGRPQQAREQVEESITILEPLDARRETAGALAGRAWISRYESGRDPDETEALMLKAATLLGETGQHELQVFMYNTLAGLKFDTGRYQESEQWYQKALQQGRSINDPRGETATLASLGRLTLTLGQYDRARQHLLESLEIARALENPVVSITALNRLGQVATATGKLEAAEDYIRESVARSDEVGKPYEVAISRINLAHVLAYSKEFVRAKDLYQESIQFDRASRTAQVERLWGLGRIAFLEGGYAEAQRLHQESLRISMESGYRVQTVKNNDALGRVALAQESISEAKSHFKLALEEGVSIGAPPIILDSLISLGELVAYEGDLVKASELAQLVKKHPASQAESKERAEQLLRQIEPALPTRSISAPSKGSAQVDLEAVASEWLNRLTVAQEPTDTVESATSQPLLDPLSERELELLRLVAEGKSNREIAAKLMLALGTVKSHLHNIYQKLDASSRTQAIVRARELDLL